MSLLRLHSQAASAALKPYQWRTEVATWRIKNLNRNLKQLINLNEEHTVCKSLTQWRHDWVSRDFWRCKFVTNMAPWFTAEEEGYCWHSVAKRGGGGGGGYCWHSVAKRRGGGGESRLLKLSSCAAQLIFKSAVSLPKSLGCITAFRLAVLPSLPKVYNNNN